MTLSIFSRTALSFRSGPKRFASPVALMTAHPSSARSATCIAIREGCLASSCSPRLQPTEGSSTLSSVYLVQRFHRWQQPSPRDSGFRNQAPLPPLPSFPPPPNRMSLSHRRAHSATQILVKGSALSRPSFLETLAKPGGPCSFPQSL